MRLYMNTRKPKYVEKFLSALFTDRDEFAIKLLSKAFSYYKMDFTPVPTITVNDVKKIKTPITLFAAENHIIFPGNKMMKRAIIIIPSLKQTILIEHSKHVQNLEENMLVENYILEL